MTWVRLEKVIVLSLNKSQYDFFKIKFIGPCHKSTNIHTTHGEHEKKQRKLDCYRLKLDMEYYNPTVFLGERSGPFQKLNANTSLHYPSV